MLNEEIIDWTTEYPTLQWQGYEWQHDAEAHRKIHPDNPHQYYHWSAVNEDLRGVVLTMKDRPQKVRNWNQNPDEYYQSRYARGMLRSVDTFTYGVFTLKCILPEGRGLHSSFWLSCHESWPPEIDIFEAYSNKFGGYATWPAKVWPNIIRPGYKVQTNAHYGVLPDHFQIETEECFLSDLKKPAGQINEYKLVWTPDEIAIYFNNTLVRLINDIMIPELFKDLNKSPWMHIVIDIGAWSKDLNKDLEMKQFKKDPNWHPEFILKEFNYSPIIES